MSHEVILTKYEMQMAGSVGLSRGIESISAGNKQAHGCSGDGWGQNIEGAYGELAFAKFINRYWSGSVNTFKDGGDVGDIQVRTRSKHHYDLIVRDGDRDNDIFVLVTGLAPSYLIRGWIKGIEAKRMDDCIKAYGGRPSAWFVPADRLKPVPKRDRK
jgi:hypothetical protein